MKKTGARVFVYYMIFQSLIYAFLLWEPVEIHYFSSLFSHVIQSELKTQLYYQHTAIFVFGYLTMISSCIILVLSRCTKNERFFYYCYLVLLFIHSITLIYSIYISIMSIYNLVYIQTDKFTELLKEDFVSSADRMELHFQCCGFMNATIEYKVKFPYSCCERLFLCTFENIYKVTCKNPIISAFAPLIKSIGGVAIASFFIELGFFLTVFYSWFPSGHDSLDSPDSANSPENDVNANTECIIMETDLK